MIRTDRTILLVEDDSDLRLLIAEELADAGYAVSVAADGVEALEAAHGRRPDLIVTDVMMPRLDGPGLYRALRDAPPLDTVPVIFLTALRDLEDGSRLAGCEEAGRCRKPVDFDVLLDLVAETLDPAV